MGKLPPFELHVGPFVNYELEVLSFRGREPANDAYRYDVTFATEVDEDTLHASIFGAPGCLTIKAPGRVKDVQGKPRANARVLLTKGTDKTAEQRITVLDADGELDLIGDAQYTISFPDDPVAK